MRFVWIIAVVVALAPPAWADFDEGVAAYQRGDYAGALMEWRALAKRGNSHAQFGLGALYDKGKGVMRNPVEAARWYRAAADQGNAEAQLNLALLYDVGRGVTQDYTEALRWYQGAAEQGSALAHLNLGLMYATGKGVTQDYIQAHKWYNLAAARSRKGKTRNLAISARDTIAQLMTRTQLGEAQRLARDWRPRKTATPRAPLQPRSTHGSGIVINRAGHVLTNAHVVDGCRTISATTASLIEPSGIAVGPKARPFGTRTLKLVAADVQGDLAVLESSALATSIATFRTAPSRTGERVIVAGFPLPGVLTSDLHVTTGTISASMGPGNDINLIQVTAPIQPGNSGGPVLDASGHVVGVVVARLDALKLAQRTGRLPQNVNFAISGATARKFLDTHKIGYRVGSSALTMPAVDIAARARGFTVAVECMK